jgi:hypothetical protein
VVVLSASRALCAVLGFQCLLSSSEALLCVFIDVIWLVRS